MVSKKIIFRFEAYKELGMGHAYRSVQLIKQFSEYECLAVLSARSSLAFALLEDNNIPYALIEDDEGLFRLLEEENAGIVVNDILNTDRQYIERLKSFGCRIINIEDEGSGADAADAVINELYESVTDKAHTYYGSEYYCLPEEIRYIEKNPFRQNVREIILLFGCTDPANLTVKTVGALEKVENLDSHITIVVGPGNDRKQEIKDAVRASRHRKNIAIVENAVLKNVMEKADLALCSQGRTMFELAHFCIPAVIMAQNEREKTHTFAALKNGFVNLGLGEDVADGVLANAVVLLLGAAGLRKELYDYMASLHLEKGVDRVKKIITEIAEA